jgi:hypothetical protein
MAHRLRIWNPEARHNVPGLRAKYPLAFDHPSILGDGVERAQRKLETTSLATAFVDSEFSMSDLRGVCGGIAGW